MRVRLAILADEWYETRRWKREKRSGSIGDFAFNDTDLKMTT
jgi:hypothetical protein